MKAHDGVAESNRNLSNNDSQGRTNSVLRRALSLARLGYFVGPLKPLSKNPGSRLGKRWQTKTSNDPDTVEAWFVEYPDDGLFLHLGKSNLIAFDLDIDSGLVSLPTHLAEALKSGLFQRSRGKGDRGHYVFRTDEDFGNGAGGFSAWGDVRGRNGVIVLAPTIHPKTRKAYRHIRGKWSEVPELPGELRKLLRAAGGSQRAALSDHEFHERVTSLKATMDPSALGRRCEHFRTLVDSGESRHSAMLTTALLAMRDAQEGSYPASEAIERLREEFNRAFSMPRPGERSSPAPSEFDGILRWAAAQLSPIEAISEIFDATPVLRMVKRFAQEHSVSPFALLGVGIVRALASLPPNRALPPIIATEAPLNLFVALVGPSGAGKGAAEDLAKEVFVAPASVEGDLYLAKPGSSEGIAKLFGRMVSKGKGTNRRWEAEFFRSRVIASLPEVDTFAALLGRDGSHLSATLREVWSGSRLGYDYANVETRFVVGGKRYRFCMIVGVQPERAAAIVNGKDGGLPQRFLWTDVTVPSSQFMQPTGDRSDLTPIKLPEVADEISATAEWRTKMLTDAKSEELHSLAIPSEVRAQILKARELALQGLVPDIEGHRLLVQSKVAMGLSILHGSVGGYDLSHWELAGLVLQASDHTYSKILKALHRSKNSIKEKDAKERGRLRELRNGAEYDALLDQVKSRLLDVLSEQEEIAKSALRRRVSRRQRDLVDDALNALQEARLIGRRRRKMKNGDFSIHFFVMSAA